MRHMRIMCHLLQSYAKKVSDLTKPPLHVDSIGEKKAFKMNPGTPIWSLILNLLNFGFEGSQSGEDGAAPAFATSRLRPRKPRQSWGALPRPQGRGAGHGCHAATPCHIFRKKWGWNMVKPTEITIFSWFFLLMLLIIIQIQLPKKLKMSDPRWIAFHRRKPFRGTTSRESGSIEVINEKSLSYHHIPIFSFLLGQLP